MSAHDFGSLLNFVIVAVVIIATLASRLRGARGKLSVWAAQQRAEAERVVAATLAARQAALSAQQSGGQQSGAQQSGAQAYVAQQPYAAQAYAAQQAYTPQQAGTQHAAAAQHAVTHKHASGRRVVPPPSMRSLDVPPTSGTVPVPGRGRSPAGALLAEAFGDPAHARGAVILAEVIGPPVALR